MDILKKTVKKCLSSFCLISALLCTTSAFADAPAMSAQELTAKSNEMHQMVTEQLNATSIEDFQKNLGNRLILGVFGKDALLYSLTNDVPDNIKNSIRTMGESELIHYSTPFNIKNLSGLLMIFSSFFFVAITVLGMYFCWVLFEGLFNTQDSGQMLGDKTNTMFSVLKGTTAFALIVPVYGFSHKPFSDFHSATGKDYGSYSLAQISVFIAMGYSNKFADYIWGSFVNAYQKAYPSIMLPNTNSKEDEMSNVLNFMMCVKSTNSNNKAIIDMKYSNGEILYSSTFESCSLKGGVSFDKKTFDEMNKSKELREALGGKDITSFEGLYKEKLIKMLKHTFKNAESYANLILTERNTYTENRNSSPLLVTPSNWQSLCKTPEKMFKKNELANEDTYELAYYLTKCMSNEFVLNYLSENENKARSLYDINILTNHNIPICNSNAALANGNRTYVKSDTLFNENQEMSLKKCVEQSCESTEKFGLYQCFASLEFAKASVTNKDMIKQGWLNAGAYSYVLFSGFKNNLSREMVSSFSASFMKTPSGMLNTTSADPLMIISGKNEINKDLKIDFLNYTTNRKLKIDELETAKKSSDVLLGTGSNAKNIITGEDGLFGITKFLTCSENPSSITDRFMCGTITEEMHDFGAKMLAFSLEMKTAKSIGKVINVRYNTSANGTGAMAKSKLKATIAQVLNGKSSLLDAFGKAVLGNGITAGGLIGGGLLFAGVATADAFSEDGYWLQDNETYLVVIAIIADKLSVVGEFIDFFVDLLLFLGILFGFFLPLLPYFLWLTVITGWAIMILEFLVIVPVWAATLISPSNDHTSQTAKKGLLLLLTITMRAPFLIIGLVLAWMLSNSLIGEILSMSNIADSMLLQQSSGLSSLLDAIIKLVVYLSLLYMIYNLVFSIIEGFYEVGSNWLFNGALSPFASKDRAENWRSGFKSSQNFLGAKK